MAYTSDGECIIAPQLQSPGPAWPWAGGAVGTPTGHISQMSHDRGYPSATWPYIGPQWGTWGMPWGGAPPPPLPGSSEAIGGWHPSVPNTGYNTVPTGALPYADYATPVGDHLTVATKEKI